MRALVVTLFPELFETFLATSLIGRAVESGAISVAFKSPREFGLGKHRSVDDTPYGGGSGMVMRVDCVVQAIEAIEAEDGGDRAHRVLLSPAGARIDQAKVVELAARPKLLFVCGRYEGVDDRVGAFVDEELSLGDFVMTGGELAAMAILDATTRLLPGVLGNAASAASESHSAMLGGLLEYPQFTRPPIYREFAVPDVLQGGNHASIAAWRRAETEKRTAERRPDLLLRKEKSE